MPEQCSGHLLTLFLIKVPCKSMEHRTKMAPLLGQAP